MRFRADRRMLFAAGIVILICLCLVLAGVVRSLRKENASLQAKQKELLLLKGEALTIKGKVDASEARKSLTKVEGVVQAVDEIVKSMGLSQKVKSVKPTGTRDRLYAIEEEAEVQFEKMNMNEMVNLFFRIENAPMILSIRKTTVKTSFENPSLLNISATISLVKPSAEANAGAQNKPPIQAPTQTPSQASTQTPADSPPQVSTQAPTQQAPVYSPAQTPAKAPRRQTPAYRPW